MENEVEKVWLKNAEKQDEEISASEVDFIQNLKEMNKYRICQCELSGELHVVSEDKGDHCELCNVKERRPLTVENVREAFKFMEDQLNTLLNEKKHK